MPIFLLDQPELTYEITYGFINIFKYLSNLNTYRWTLLCIIPLLELVLRVLCKKLYGIEQRVGRRKKYTTGDLKASVVQINVVCDRNTRRTICLTFERILG